MVNYLEQLELNTCYETAEPELAQKSADVVKVDKFQLTVSV